MPLTRYSTRCRFPRSRSITVLFVGVLAVVLSAIGVFEAGCGSGATTTTAAPTGATSAPTTTATTGTAQVTKLIFLYSPYTDYAPFFIAKDKGYFAKYGLDVDLRIKSGTAETDQLVATGNAESGGSTWGAAFFNTVTKGATIVISTPLTDMPSIQESPKSPSPLMVSKKAYDAGLKTIADLKGKKIGIPGPGGFGEYSTALALQLGGLTLADIEAVYLGPPDIGPAMTSGGIDAAWTIEPFSTLLEQQGIALRLSDDHARGVSLGFICFNSDWAAKNQDAVVRFTAAQIKAIDELNSGGWSDPAILGIISKWTQLDVSFLKDIQRSKFTDTINMDSVRAQEKFFQDRDELEYTGLAPLDSVILPDILQKAKDFLSANPL